MIEQEELPKVEKSFSLSERRAFMKLSIEERRKRLLKQAAQSVEYYENEQAQKERQQWQGGDIIEY